MYSQNDSTRVGVSNSYFTGNSVENFGGAINVAGGIDFTIDRCEFFGNQANFGGAVAISEDSLDLAQLTLTNSIFNLNVAETQGGALNIDNASTEITSCLFYSNIAIDPGTGGAISTNASGEHTLEITMRNSTLAFNTGGLANGLAAYTDGVAPSQTTLLNNIFHNPDGLNYAVEEGSPEVLSVGGNFCTDLSMSDVLTSFADIIDEDGDPLFVNESDEDFHLGDGSPCIDAGVNVEVPEFDLDGNPRVGMVDIGAYEYQGPVNGTQEVLIANGNQLKLSPNPASDQVSIELKNDWSGNLQMQIVSASGQQMKRFEVEKRNEYLKIDRQLADLPSGVYQLTVSNGQQMIVFPFIMK